MLKKLNINYFIPVGTVVLIFIFGSYIAITRGSNLSDGDSYSLILSFLDLKDLHIYHPSRGAYGHLIPEMLLGSTAYFFGTPISNLISFIFFFISIFVLSITFFEKNIQNFALFLLLISSNFYLLFDNTNTIDYPVALFFFSVGLYLLKKEKFIYSSIFFAITICCRANFCIFIYPIIFIYFYHSKILFQKFKSLILILSLTTVIGLIFFVPVFYVNNFTLDFLNIPFITKSESPGWYGGPALNFTSLFPRFIYKIYNFVGPFSSLFIVTIFLLNFKILTSLKTVNQKIIWSVIILNLIIYFLTPTKIFIINPFLLFLYILCFTYLRKKIIYGIIVLNFIPWFVTYNLLNIEYKNTNICDAKVALSANFTFSVKQGEFINYLNQPSFAICYSKELGNYSNNFLNNRPLRLAQ
jgi:hypothetical protein